MKEQVCEWTYKKITRNKTIYIKNKEIKQIIQGEGDSLNLNNNKHVFYVLEPSISVEETKHTFSPKQAACENFPSLGNRSK